MIIFYTAMSYLILSLICLILFYKDYCKEVKEDFELIFTEQAQRTIVFVYIMLFSPAIILRELYDYIYTWFTIISIKIILYKLKRKNKLK